MQKRSEPKHVQLTNTIREWVQRGALKPGDQLPTEWQLAAQFGMSRQTVRLAVNALVFENILVRQQGRGTFVTEGLNLISGPSPVSGGERTVAVIVTYLTDYIFPSIIEGIEQRLSDQGFSMLLFNTDNSFEKEALVLNRLRQRTVDGIILEPTRSALTNPNFGTYLELYTRGIPMVSLHSSLPELPLPNVRLDDVQGGRLAASHLIRLGHARIGALMKQDDTQGQFRFRGVLEELARHSVQIDTRWLQRFTTDERQTVSSAYVRAWMNTPHSLRPTAIICYNDQIAMDLKSVFLTEGFRVPDDVSIVGFDDSHIAALSDLTSVLHPKRTMGVQVADTLLARMRVNSDAHPHGEHEGAPLDIVLEPTLVVRNSSQSPQ